MVYMFRYAGDDRPRPVDTRTEAQRKKDRERQAKLRKREQAKKDDESRATGHDASHLLVTENGSVPIQFVPPPSCGLPPSYRKILQEVCEKHRVAYTDVLSPSRKKHLTHARGEMMFRCMEEIPSASYSGVGRRMSRDHTTVLYAHRKGLKNPRAFDPFVSVDKSLPGRKRKRHAGFNPTQAEIIKRVKSGEDYKDIAEKFGRHTKWLTNQLFEIRQKIAMMSEKEKLEKGLGANFGRVAGTYIRSEKDETQ